MGIQFQHSFMVMPCTNGVAESGKPCSLDQSRVKRQVCTGNAASVESVHVFRIGFEPCVFEGFGTIHQLLYLLLDLGIGGMVGVSNETVVRVLPTVHGPHAVKLPHKHSGE